MSLADTLVSEIKREAVNTRKMMEKIPEDKFSWRPHEKSMSVIGLATHIAELPALYVSHMLQSTEINLATLNYKRPVFSTKTSLIQFFDNSVEKAITNLKKASDDDLAQSWTLRNGEQVIITLPRKGIIRSLAFNHLIHHRGQLSVYLRLLDITVPGMYGPSADEKNFHSI